MAGMPGSWNVRPVVHQRKAGELLAAMDKAKGAAEPGTNRGATRSHDVTASSLSDLGITKSQSSRWQKTAALEAYLRGKELQKPILGAQRRVEARIGQLLGEAQQATNQHTEPLRMSNGSIERRADRHDFRLLARGFECLADEEWRRSRRALVSVVRNKLGLRAPTPPLPAGQFRCIAADPPWPLDTGPEVFGGTGEAGHDKLCYEQKPLAQIEAPPVAEHAADDAHLYLWTTNKYVEAGGDNPPPIPCSCWSARCAPARLVGS
ncbi:MAG: hypothetical protein L0H73_07075 [Nitrococcus sp.]|nr:hypothetical protein [Nitrococcus sp.]